MTVSSLHIEFHRQLTKIVIIIILEMHLLCNMFYGVTMLRAKPVNTITFSSSVIVLYMYINQNPPIYVFIYV